MANWRILRQVTKQASLQSLCRRPWWVTSCSIGCREKQHRGRSIKYEQNKEIHSSKIFILDSWGVYLVGDFADTTEGFISLALSCFLRRLLRLFLHSFIRQFVRNLISLFLLVPKDRQTELAAKVHQGAVFCWDCDHVPGLDDLPAKSETRTKCNRKNSGSHVLTKHPCGNISISLHYGLPTGKLFGSLNWGLCCAQDAMQLLWALNWPSAYSSYTSIWQVHTGIPVETSGYLLHWKQLRFLKGEGRWPVRHTVEQKSCVEPFLWKAVWPFSRTWKCKMTSLHKSSQETSSPTCFYYSR